MEQRIEAPTDEEFEHLARQLVHADSVARQVTGRGLTGSRDDLALIQQILDSGSIEPEATYTLEALGMAFGKVFVEQHAGYDWWMVEDEYGRDPAIRFEQTALLTFPLTMLSKRVEDGESIDVLELFESLSERLAELSAEMRS